ncbi:hypothetical protein ABH313_18940 [Chromobacterium vaccinii]|uniref:hypothetical protein n=1 Tax=Chromobacterium vaccinii TaxID=1108595 RepID=UPI0032612D40
MNSYTIEFKADLTPSQGYQISFDSMHTGHFMVPDNHTPFKIKPGTYKLTWELEGVIGDRLTGELIIKDRYNNPVSFSPIKINDSIYENNYKIGALAPITFPEQ